SAASEPLARDVILILDISGSMRGEKLAQAKGAARYILDNLGPQDRYNIVAFGSGTRVLASDLLAANNREEGRRFIQELVAGGGTNIQRAFLDALRLTDSGRPQLLLFLTDGLPTEGETRVEEILRQVEKRAGEQVRIFCFGVGYDVNTWLLDRLAQDHGGTTVYVRPEEDIERAVSSFYDKIGSPILTDVAVDFGAVRVDETYPYPLPDLFAGEQLVLVGRYRQPGTTDITLRGTVNGNEERYTFRDIRFRSQGGADFIPRLWATRKIGHLLTQIRLHGEDKELVDEIIALGIRYGIATPYTSFLVDEGEDRAPATPPILYKAPPPRVLGRGGGGESTAVQPAAPAAQAVGKEAVDTSIAQEQLRKAEVIAPVAEQMRAVGSKTFELREQVWVDTTYDPNAHRLERVAFGSPAYFELLSRWPDVGRYLALGPRVLFVQGRIAYEVSPEGKTAPSPTRETPVPPSSPSPTPWATEQLASPTATPTTDNWWHVVSNWFRAILKD
ncbi:MAG: VWA domain-containing protein, partial [Chloroflexi bacterium]|nr:VWA domain-containing protein [Chloroflexota bacterium]